MQAHSAPVVLCPADDLISPLQTFSLRMETPCEHPSDLIALLHLDGFNGIHTQLCQCLIARFKIFLL